MVRVSGLAALAGDERWVTSVEDLLDAIDSCSCSRSRPQGAGLRGGRGGAVRFV